jgi:hypothetical protein
MRKPSINISGLDYNLDAASFAEKYAYKLNGPRRFLLMLAYFAKGRANTPVPVLSVRDEWRKLSGKNQLGSFNGLYSNKAKKLGGADSLKRGVYILTDNWQNCF